MKNYERNEVGHERYETVVWSPSVLRLAVVVVWVASLGIANAQTGNSANAPKVSFYAGLGESCCGEDPHPVHGIATPDGGYLLVGKSATPGDGWGGFAVKIGPPEPMGIGTFLEAGESSSVRWITRIGTAGTRSVLLNAASTRDAVFLAGSRATSDGSARMYLAKHRLDNGQLMWEKRLDGAEEGTDGAIETIEITSDGGLIAGAVVNAPRGALEGFKSFGNPSGGEAHVFRLSAEQVNADEAPRAVQWSQTFRQHQTVKAVRAVGAAENGYIVLAHGEDQPPTLLRLNAGGDTQWSSEYFGRFEPTDLAVNTMDGRPSGFTFTGHGGDDETLDGQLTHVDLEGRLVWTKTFGNPIGGVGPFVGLESGNPKLIYDECWGVKGTPDGGVVVGCGTGIEGCDGWSPGSAIRRECDGDPRRTWRGYVVRFDRDGRQLWQRLDSFVDPNDEGVADAASEYVFLTADGRVGSVVDQGFGIGLLVTEPDLPNGSGPDNMNDDLGGEDGERDSSVRDAVEETDDDRLPDEDDVDHHGDLPAIDDDVDDELANVGGSIGVGSASRQSATPSREAEGDERTSMDEQDMMASQLDGGCNVSSSRGRDDILLCLVSLCLFSVRTRRRRSRM